MDCIQNSETKSKYLNNYNEVMPYLYVGNRYALADIYLFDLVINCTADIPFPNVDIQKKYKQEYSSLEKFVRMYVCVGMCVRRRSMYVSMYFFMNL